jgi:hypothetical protein
MEPITKFEAKILAGRWCVDQRAVLKWMKARGFTSLLDLMVFTGTHAECMDRAVADFWEFST